MGGGDARQRVLVTDDDPLLRKHGLTALAMIAGRALEQGRPLGDASVVTPVVAISNSADPEPTIMPARNSVTGTPP